MSRLPELHCPYCGGSLEHERGHGLDEYGVLACPCNRYPVVAGIPVLKGHFAGGGRIRDVVALIERSAHREALLAMLTPAGPAPAPSDGVHRRLAALPGIGRVYARRASRALAAWRERLAEMLTRKPRATALEILDWYYRRSPVANPEAYNYFAFRFTQPRHLVALALLGLIRQPARPILELGCGLGHVTRSLLHLAGGQPVVGIDQNFFALFMARNWIAPGASFVCYAMDGALPFSARTFSAAVCVDGIHYVEPKTTTLREMMRTLVDDGLVILACSRNAAFDYPYAGFALPVEGYRRLVADVPHRMLADGDVLEHYLKGISPPLDHTASPERLAASPLLSIVASPRGDLTRHGCVEPVPHDHGRLGVNPLYLLERQSTGGAVLRRAFPSAFYAEDNREAASYLPEEVTLSAETVSALDEGRRTPEIDGLIARHVVLGLPEHYGRRERSS